MAENQEPSGFIAGIWAEVKAFFVLMFESVWSGFELMVTHIFTAAYQTFRFSTVTTVDAYWDTVLDGFKIIGFITADDAKELAKFKKFPWPLNTIIIVIGSVLLLLSPLVAFFRSMVSRTQQAHSKVMRDGLPHYAEILSAALIAPEKTGEIRDVAKRHGLSDDEINLLFLNLYRAYEEGTIRTLWLRDILNDDQMYMRMRELGYTDTRIKEIIQSWPLLPPPGDLFTMVAHEAFEPDIYVPLGLDKEFPAEQVKWLKQQGISKDWAEKYWISHWDQPSIGHGFEMLHRGVIDRSTLDMLFKAIEIPDFWREKLTAIAYNPYTRVDVRRMHDLNILSTEEVLTSYMDQGYDLEKATNMTKFTIAYNAEHNKELTKSEVLSGYRTGAIDKTDAVSLLKKIDYSESQAEYLVAYEDYKQALDLVDLQVANIRDRFQASLISRAEAQSRLDSLNLPSKQVQAYLERWELERYFDKKLPSRTDLNKFWLGKIITDDEYIQEMTRLGYSWQYIQWYQKLVTKTRKA